MKDAEIVSNTRHQSIWVKGDTFRAACAERDRLRALVPAGPVGRDHQRLIFAWSGVGHLRESEVEQFATTSTGFPVYRSRTP